MRSINHFTEMSSQEPPRDLVTNEPRATAVPDPARPDSSQQTEAPKSTLVALKDALVVSDRLIGDVSLERSRIRRHIIQQRTVLDSQTAHLSATDTRTEKLQLLYDRTVKLGSTANN